MHEYRFMPNVTPSDLRSTSTKSPSGIETRREVSGDLASGYIVKWTVIFPDEEKGAVLNLNEASA